MARKKIKQYQVFWAMTLTITLWVILSIGLKVWKVTHEPEKALQAERRHRISENYTAPSMKEVISDSSQNLNNIREGKFTEKAKWPKVPERKKVVLPVDNGDEKVPVKDPANSYYGDGK